jgi:hypothetical protein
MPSAGKLDTEGEEKVLKRDSAFNLKGLSQRL